jgi:hypothetical protein
VILFKAPILNNIYRHPAAVLVASRRAMIGPRAARGIIQKNSAESTYARCLFGTSSQTTNVNVSCTAPPIPIKTDPPISVFTVWAVAPMIPPMRPKHWPPIKKYLLPRMSPIRPTTANQNQPRFHPISNSEK